MSMTPYTSRRRFLISSAIAPIIITTRKASASQAIPISSSVLSSVTAAAAALSTGLVRGAPTQSQFANAATAVYSLQQNLASINYLQLVVNTVPGVVTANGVVPYNGSLQDQMVETAQALGWTNLTPSVFAMTSSAQPTSAQAIAAHQTLNNYNYNLNNLSASLRIYAAIAGRNSALRSKSFLRYAVNNPADHYMLRKVDAKSTAEVAAGAGGVSVAGGAAFMAGSGTSLAELATASLSAASMFTAGAALVVIGIGIAGYYGWQYLQSQQQSGGGGNSPILDVNTYPIRQFEDE